MTTARTFFLVFEGVVTPATADTEWDGTENVLTYAADPEEALTLAVALDREECVPGKLMVDGHSVMCLSRECLPPDARHAVETTRAARLWIASLPGLDSDPERRAWQIVRVALEHVGHGEGTLTKTEIIALSAARLIAHERLAAKKA